MNRQTRRTIAKEFLILVACAVLSASWYLVQTADVGFVQGRLSFSCSRAEAKQLKAKAQKLQREAARMDENRREGQDELYNSDRHAWIDRWYEIQKEEKELWKASSDLNEIADSRRSYSWMIVPVLFYPVRLVVLGFIWSVSVLRERSE